MASRNGGTGRSGWVSPLGDGTRHLGLWKSLGWHQIDHFSHSHKWAYKHSSYLVEAPFLVLWRVSVWMCIC